jgi:hypothetical protein
MLDAGFLQALLEKLYSTWAPQVRSIVHGHSILTFAVKHDEGDGEFRQPAVITSTKRTRLDCLHMHTLSPR